MKIIDITARITAIVLLCLGTIHCAFTPVIIKNIPGDIRSVFLYMFLSTGLAFLYLGTVMLIEIRRFRRKVTDSLLILNISMGLALAAGIMAVFTMPENPFAWITFATVLPSSVIIFGKQLVRK